MKKQRIMSRKPFYEGDEKVWKTIKIPKPKKPILTEEKYQRYLEGRYELPSLERLMIDFWYERREPKNEEERQLQKEVLEIKASSKSLHIDGEVF
ncbi:hypothetical protein [Namhaeicola litoreus]|uniref:Uncharacterized protein n=1 Tax=Namhaeicola litoreus TaxID=1052145 RepID=A0ABW3Y3W4_9FLAO